MIKYKVVKRSYPKSGNAKEHETCYTAFPIRTRVVDAKELADRICHSSSLTRGDVMAVITNLLDEMKIALFNGDTLKLDDIGTFSISASSEKCKTPEDVTPSKVKACRICFRSSDSLRRELKNVKFGLKK